MPEVVYRKLTLVIPGLDPPGLYDEECVFPSLSSWLRQHTGIPPGLPDPPLYVNDSKVRAYRIFFLDGERVAAAITLSLYFDPSSPTQFAGFVTDAYWGDLRDIKPLLEVLSVTGRRLELGSIIIPSREAAHQRQFAMMGYEPHAAVIFSNGSATEPTHYYRGYLAHS